MVFKTRPTKKALLIKLRLLPYLITVSFNSRPVSVLIAKCSKIWYVGGKYWLVYFRKKTTNNELILWNKCNLVFLWSNNMFLSVLISTLNLLYCHRDMRIKFLQCEVIHCSLPKKSDPIWRSGLYLLISVKLWLHDTALLAVPRYLKVQLVATR